MPRKKLTDEQRQALNDRMAKARAARKLKKETPDDSDIDSRDTDNRHSQDTRPVLTEAPTVTLTQEQFQMILDRLAATPEAPASPQAVEQAFGSQPQLSPLGGVVGVVERFPIDPKYYHSPVEALYDLPELRRFSMRENYLIEWTVTPTKYQTAMGTWYVEPRFELTLKRKQFDQETGEEAVRYDDQGKPYHPRIVLGRASFFEDPPANIIEAEQAGVSVDDLDKPEFQEKMRMHRYRAWLVERLNPRPPKYSSSHRREEVIGGKVYEIDNYNKPY